MISYRFEYLVENVAGKDYIECEDAQRHFNARGVDGWELINHEYATGRIALIWKRRVA